MFGNLGLGEFIVILILLLPAIFWVVALVDILRSNFQGNNKIVWVLVVIFLPLIGAILYFTICRSQKIQNG